MTSTITDRLTGSAVTANSRTSGLGSSKAIKAPCRVKTTANITLSGLQTIDGVSVVADDWVCVGSQTAQTANGIYVASSGTWTRRSDFDDNADVETGTLVYVTAGSVGSGFYAVTTVADPIVIGTDNITFGAVAFPTYALLASPAFTGNPTAPTASPGDSDTSIATTAFVAAGLALKADLASPALTGNPTAPTATPGDNDTTIASTAFVTAAVSTAVSGISVASGAGGRLTLTTGVPVQIATVTGITTVYFTPYQGRFCPIYNGTSFTASDYGGELSNILANTATGKAGPVAAAADSNYDLFVWNDSGTFRLTRGPAWTSDTGRGTGAGTTEYVLVQGIPLNANAITNGPAAQRGTLVGTVRTNGVSGVIDFRLTTVSASEVRISLSNVFNRRMVAAVGFEGTDSWTYTTAAWRAFNGGTTAAISFLSTLPEDSCSAEAIALAANSTTTINRYCAIGLNVSNAPAAGCIFLTATETTAANVKVSMQAKLKSSGLLGWNYYFPLEYSVATGTCTWYGDNGAALLQSGIIYQGMY